MERYSKVTGKIDREIVLLKARPCAWGKCRFCDYIADNSLDVAEMVALNRQVLARVTGEFGVLEVIDSASCFELPAQTLADIRQLIQKKHIHKLFLEEHWIYRGRLQEMRDYFGIPIVFKIGVESFDEDFRENYLNKHADFHSPEEVAALYDSACMMVGIKGQTKDMIRKDMTLLKQHFKHGTVNVYTNNTTDVVQDPELVKWFREEYGWMADDPDLDVLFANTDFGVGD